MFFFCNPKPLTITFFTAREDVFLHAKPRKASDFIPDWFKQLRPPGYPEDPSKPLEKTLNIKTCPGFVNLYRKGVMFPMWSDLSVEVTGDNYRYQFSDNVSSAAHHTMEQFKGSKFNHEYIELKLFNPWSWSFDRDIDAVYTAPSWNGFGYGDIVVAPGAYSAYNLPGPANINLFFKKNKDRTIYELPFGLPLVHAVPITERKLIIKYELVTEKEFERRWLASGIKLFGSNRYRRINKLCPYGR